MTSATRFKPLFFGPPTASLYGVLHPADPGCETDTGIVICAPWADEAIVSYSYFRQVANMLAQQGYNTLRFDYLATGDSSGNDDEFTLAQAVQDSHTAIDELVSLSGCTRVLLLGARLGAHVALCTSATHPSVVGAMLMDPVCNGDDYVRRMIAAHGVDPLCDDRANAITPGETTVGINGFPVSPALYAELVELRITPQSFHGNKAYWLMSDSSALAEQFETPFRQTHVANNQALWSRSPGADMTEHSTDSLVVLREWVSTT